MIESMKGTASKKPPPIQDAHKNGIEVERYQNDDGYFYAPKGEGYEGYGDTRVTGVILSDADVFTALSSQTYLDDNKVPLPGNIRKFSGVSTWKEYEQYIYEADFSQDALHYYDKVNPGEVAEINGIIDYYRIAQRAMKIHLESRGIYPDVIKLECEDDVNNVQYWILNKRVLVTLTQQSPMQRGIARKIKNEVT